MTTRKQKSIEERLAEAQDRKAKLHARLQALGVQKKLRDNRLRGQGEKTLLRVLLQHMQGNPAFRSDVELLVRHADLRPDEEKAVEWLMRSLRLVNGSSGTGAAGQQAA